LSPSALVARIALALATAAGAGLVATDSVRTGQASFYKTGKGQGACSLPRTSPWDTLYAAINRHDWNRSGACAACLLVRGDSDSVLVRVTDRCGGCRKGGIDLSPAAFRRLAPLGRGRTSVSWRFAACPESSLSISRTRGSSSHWSSLQIWGLPWPIDSLAVRGDSGWFSFRRARHNHFTARKLPPTPWTVRMVDTRGHERVDTALALEPGSVLRPDSTSRQIPSDTLVGASKDGAIPTGSSEDESPARAIQAREPGDRSPASTSKQP
jgi:expansin (peptidoglycan-binding protein)